MMYYLGFFDDFIEVQKYFNIIKTIAYGVSPTCYRRIHVLLYDVVHTPHFYRLIHVYVIIYNHKIRILAYSDTALMVINPQCFRLIQASYWP